MQLGKMYLVKEYFWLLYPTKELVGVPGQLRACAVSRATAWPVAKWVSEQYKCNVAVVEENTCFVLLEKDEAYFKLLDSNGNIGWIYCCDDFSRYFKIVKE